MRQNLRQRAILREELKRQRGEEDGPFVMITAEELFFAIAVLICTAVLVAAMLVHTHRADMRAQCAYRGGKIIAGECVLPGETSPRKRAS